MPRSFAALAWDNSFTQLPASLFQRVRPTPLFAPRLVAFNPDVARLLDLDPGAATDPGFVEALNGTALPASADPIATIYAGHQFGVWVPQLGDGRAILLGEVVGRDHVRYDVQLKGSGITKFSRMGDGRAVLRSCVREYLGSEAMHGLGIPTTRALAIVGSDEPVYRETVETGALLVRIAPSHVRFGSFQLLTSRAMHDELAILADYVIDHHFPALLTLPAAQRYAAWFREVVERTARMIAQWTATGFTHGVLNTDNMSILGIALDYGPFAWMDEYDRGFIPNHSDSAGRYAFDQQPRVGLWNCARLGEALRGLITDDDALSALGAYRDTFEAEMDRLLRCKLGLVQREEQDVVLAGDLLALLHDTHTDFTNFFRALSHENAGARGTPDVAALVSDTTRLQLWMTRYAQRLLREDSDPDARRALMLRSNPRYVLRNWMAQEAITEAESGNFALIETLREVLTHPFDEQTEHARFAGPVPAWAKGIEISCSS